MPLRPAALNLPSAVPLSLVPTEICRVHEDEMLRSTAKLAVSLLALLNTGLAVAES